jgi:phosphonate transport system substrate-binding protein
MSRIFRYLGAFITLLFALTLFSNVAQAAEVIRLAVTDVEGLEQLQREFGAFRDVLSKSSGFDIEFLPVPNRTAAVEVMRSKKVDFVLTGPAEYVVFRTRTNALPVIGFSRPDYFTDIIVLADSKVQSVSDLKGEKVALGAVGSTSKHLAPMQVLRDYGLNPLTDIKPIHTSIKLGWEALKRGDVAAMGTTNDKFIKIRSMDKDLEPGAFRVIARSRDLPNDVLLVRPGIDKRVVDKIRQSFLDHSDALVAAILQGDDNQKYRGMKFLPDVQDSDYNYVRAMYQTVGHPQLAQFVGE